MYPSVTKLFCDVDDFSKEFEHEYNLMMCQKYRRLIYRRMNELYPWKNYRIF